MALLILHLIRHRRPDAAGDEVGLRARAPGTTGTPDSSLRGQRMSDEPDHRRIVLCVRPGSSHLAYGALACVRSGARQLDRGLAVRADQPGIFRKPRRRRWQPRSSSARGRWRRTSHTGIPNSRVRSRAELRRASAPTSRLELRPAEPAQSRRRALTPLRCRQPGSIWPSRSCEGRQATVRPSRRGRSATPG